MKTRGAKHINAMAEFIGRHNPATGAQVRGPVWTGPKPRRAVASRGYTPEHAQMNHGIEIARHPQLAFMPDSGLGRILLNRRVTRSLRRAILSTVQAPKTARRDRLERRIERELTALGITPA